MTSFRESAIHRCQRERVLGKTCVPVSWFTSTKPLKSDLCALSEGSTPYKPHLTSLGRPKSATSWPFHTGISKIRLEPILASSERLKSATPWPSLAGILLDSAGAYLGCRGDLRSPSAVPRTETTSFLPRRLLAMVDQRPCLISHLFIRKVSGWKPRYL
jgi:hypothetical protein